MALGAFIFLFGAIAFNTGSNLTVSNAKDGRVISLVCLNTLICVAAATSASLLHQRYCTASGRSLRNWNFINMLNGSFTGMASFLAFLHGISGSMFNWKKCVGCYLRRMRSISALGRIRRRLSWLLCISPSSKSDASISKWVFFIHLGGGCTAFNLTLTRFFCCILFYFFPQSMTRPTAYLFSWAEAISAWLRPLFSVKMESSWIRQSPALT